MFSKTEKSAPRTERVVAPPKPKADGAPSIISANLQVIGNLKTEGEIQVDGVIDGDVMVKSLSVGASATINGEIVADTVVVRGAVNGRIRAHSVELTKTAKVIGDILHESLSVEAGARERREARRRDPAVVRRRRPPGLSAPRLGARSHSRHSLRGGGPEARPHDKASARRLR